MSVHGGDVGANAKSGGDGGTPSWWKANTLDVRAEHAISEFDRLHRRAAGAALVALAAVSLVVLIFASITIDFANDSEECAIDKAADERNPGPIEQLTAVRAFNGIVIAFAVGGIALGGVFGGIFLYQADHAPHGVVVSGKRAISGGGHGPPLPPHAPGKAM